MPRIGESTPGFDQPLGLLSACHRRIAERLELLERLSDHVGTHGSDDPAGAAARRVLDYFDRAATHHHADEEEDLFPMLRRAEGRAGWDGALPDALDRLSREHRLLATQWAKLRPVLETITRGQHVAELRCRELIRSYRAHMSVEDGLVFPLAGRLLTDAELQRIGSSMQMRRGLNAKADDAVLERAATAVGPWVEGRAGRGEE